MAKKSTKAAAAPETDAGGDDLLAGKASKSKKAAATAATEKPAKAAKGKAAAAPAKKGKNGKAAKTEKKERVPRSDSMIPAITTALLKVKKATEYATIAESTGADIKAVRRTARKLRDDGQIGLEKEGTKVFVVAA